MVVADSCSIEEPDLPITKTVDGNRKDTGTQDDVTTTNNMRIELVVYDDIETSILNDETVTMEQPIITEKITYNSNEDSYFGLQTEINIRPKSCDNIPPKCTDRTLPIMGEILTSTNESIDNQGIRNLQKEIQIYNQAVVNVANKLLSSHETTTHKVGHENLEQSSSSDQISRSKFHKSEPSNMHKTATDVNLSNFNKIQNTTTNHGNTNNNKNQNVLPSSNSNNTLINEYVNSTVSLSRESSALKYLKKKFKSLTFGRKNNVFFKSMLLTEEVSNQIQGTYKKTSAQAIVAAIQLGIAYSVGKFSAKPDRDVLLQDFFQVEEVYFPSCGTTITPSHRFADFTMSDYSPVAFRYFRDIFSIGPDDFMTSLSIRPLRQLSNPGASGSMFFVSEDDYFIIKTVDKREAKFLQQLLPGYYMNVHQNPKTLLPKFFGLYSYKYSGKNIRLVVMNNLLPSKLEFHEKYDLKGSTFKRKASQKERAKNSPTLKDLDFIEKHPNGLELSSENHQRLMKTLQRDIRVLQSYKIMDYSLLLCVHNKVIYERNKIETWKKRQNSILKNNNDGGATTNEITTSSTTVRTGNNITNLNSRSIDDLFGEDSNENSFDIDQFLKKGIPAKNDLGEDLILFAGIIDILQNYRLIKRTEHNLKAIVHDRDTISVHNPVFYAERFLSFCSNVFQTRDKNKPAVKVTVPQPNTILKEVSSSKISNNNNLTENEICIDGDAPVHSADNDQAKSSKRLSDHEL